MSRMTRAQFLKLCAGSFVIAKGWLSTNPLFASKAASHLNPLRIYEHSAEKPSDRAPVVTGVSLSPDVKILATAGDDHIVRLWSMDDGKMLFELKTHRDWVRSTAFSKLGNQLATSGEDRVVCLWDVATGSLLRKSDEQKLGIRGIRFSPDNKTIATVGFEQVVRIYDAKELVQTRAFDAPCPDMRAVAFSPDGSLLAAGGRDGRLRCWKLPTGDDGPVVQAHTQRIRAVAFSHNGSLLASAGDDQKIHIWDNASSKLKTEIEIRGSKIMSLNWCGTNIIAAGGSDNLIHLINATTREEIGTLTGHTGTVGALDADMAGRLLVSGSFDTTARIWNLEQIVTGSTTAMNEVRPLGEVLPGGTTSSQHPKSLLEAKNPSGILPRGVNSFK